MTVLNSSEKPVKLNVPFLSNGFNCVLTFDLEYAGDLPLTIDMITSRLRESVETNSQQPTAPNSQQRPTANSQQPTASSEWQQTKVIKMKIDNGALLLWAENRKFNDFRLKSANVLPLLGHHNTSPGVILPCEFLVEWTHSLATNSRGVPYKDVTKIIDISTGESVIVEP